MRTTQALCEFLLDRVDDDRALIEAAQEAEAAFVPFSAAALLEQCDTTVALIGDSLQRNSIQGDYVLRYLAQPYADHPEFDPVWAEIGT